LTKRQAAELATDILAREIYTKHGRKLARRSIAPT
jgi:hypothetical protein